MPGSGELQAIKELVETLRNLQDVSLPVIGAILGIMAIIMIVVIVRAVGRVNTQYVPLMTQMVAQAAIQNTTLTAQTEVLVKATQADQALLSQMSQTLGESVAHFRQSHEHLRRSLAEVVKISENLSDLVHQNTEALNKREALEQRLSTQERLIVDITAENTQLRTDVELLKTQVASEITARERVERERDGLIDQNKAMSRKIEELQRKVQALEEKMAAPKVESTKVSQED